MGNKSFFKIQCNYFIKDKKRYLNYANSQIKLNLYTNNNRYSFEK